MQRNTQFGNRIIQQKNEESVLKKHLEKLKQINTGNSSVHEYQTANDRKIRMALHVQKHNKKKELNNELHWIEVQRQNLLLLERLHKYVKSPRSINTYLNNFLENSQQNDSILTQRPSKKFKLASLNEPFRKNELIRINEENMEIQHRIKQQKPMIKAANFEKDFRTQEKYLKNLMVFSSLTPRNKSHIKNSRKLSLENGVRYRESYQEDRANSTISYNPEIDHLIPEKISIFKKITQIGFKNFRVEIIMEDNLFKILLDCLDSNDTYIMVMTLEDGYKLLSKYDHDHERIISKIYFENGKPKLDKLRDDYFMPGLINLSKKNVIELTFQENSFANSKNLHRKTKSINSIEPVSQDYGILHKSIAVDKDVENNL